MPKVKSDKICLIQTWIKEHNGDLVFDSEVIHCVIM